MNTILSIIERGYSNWNDATILTEVAELLDNLNRLNFAITFSKRAVELDPSGSHYAYLVWAFASFRTSETLPETGNAILAKGYAATSSPVLRAWMAAVAENEDDAKAWLSEVSNDTSFDTQVAVANAYSWRGKMNEAYQILKTFPERYAFDGNPEWGAYCSMLMYLKQSGMEQDLEKDVLPHIERLLSSNPNNPVHHSLLMKYHSVTNNLVLARDTALDCLNVFPDDETTMYTLAGIYEKLNDIPSAIHWCSRAIGAKNSYVAARIRLSGYYENVGNQDLADFLMYEIPKVNSTYSLGSIRLAIYLYRNGKEMEALSIFIEAFPKLKPWEQASISNNDIGKILMEKSGIIHDKPSE